MTGEKSELNFYFPDGGRVEKWLLSEPEYKKIKDGIKAVFIHKSDTC